METSHIRRKQRRQSFSAVDLTADYSRRRRAAELENMDMQLFYSAGPSARIRAEEAGNAGNALRLPGLETYD